MVANGIVAVGDISNTLDTLKQKAKHHLAYYSFVELYDLDPTRAADKILAGLEIQKQFQENCVRASLVPHAPYSVSRSLFGLISEYMPAAVISIHNQESEEENKYYYNKSGLVNDLLHSLKIDDSSFVATGKPSLASYLPLLSAQHRLILVHNTYSNAQDVAFAMQYSDNVHWCLCPNANLYIENRLPDIAMLVKAGVHLCVGTDSLASNHELSVLGELLTIKKNYPSLSWETLLSWGTKNGAAALQLTDVVGAIEVGKKPGILQLTHINSSEPIVNRIA
jgi:cytosine/adenosine deaminase-related metal-dependent hydrolase